MIKKNKPYRSKKTLKAAKDQPCMKCGKNDGTTASAHYTGAYQQRLGKGIGQKCSDLVSAFLCDEHHKYFDRYEGIKDGLEKIELSREFLVLCLLTLEWKFKNGIHK